MLGAKFKSGSPVSLILFGTDKRQFLSATVHRAFLLNWNTLKCRFKKFVLSTRIVIDLTNRKQTLKSKENSHTMKIRYLFKEILTPINVTYRSTQLLSILHSSFALFLSASGSSSKLLLKFFSPIHSTGHMKPNEILTCIRINDKSKIECSKNNTKQKK